VVTSNDALWRVLRAGPEQATMTRPLHDDVYGSMTERIQHEGNKVTVFHGDRIVARLEFGVPMRLERVRTPIGDSARDAAMVIPPEAFEFRALGGGLHACELTQANARVFVIEFADALFVFEGLFTSRNAESFLKAAVSRFGKPVKHFAFSHLHPQYVGGVRAYANCAATILVPPNTAELVHQALKAPFGLRPDEWSRADQKSNSPRIETFMDLWHREDDQAAVDVIHNRRSDHTDEYVILYLPRTKTLLTGDLLFLRPGQPLTGRSLTLAKHLEDLGLQVDRCLTTWPLRWPGKNDVSGEELRKATTAAQADASSPERGR
jgi:glyoxylase-like metal-dependent hydrolase (beta-lactamase superfamily II)